MSLFDNPPGSYEGMAFSKEEPHDGRAIEVVCYHWN